MHKLKIKGFTLIELLVVIAIISVLALMGFAAFRGLQGRGNDARRISDINAIAKAYEVTYNPSTGYRVLVPSDFASGRVPTPPEGGNCSGNYCGLLTTTQPGFRVCAGLGGFTGTCTATGANCYCVESSQGTYVSSYTCPGGIQCDLSTVTGTPGQIINSPGGPGSPDSTFRCTSSGWQFMGNFDCSL